MVYIDDTGLTKPYHTKKFSHHKGGQATKKSADTDIKLIIIAVSKSVKNCHSILQDFFYHMKTPVEFCHSFVTW